jgi:fumarate reductase subunit D
MAIAKKAIVWGLFAAGGTLTAFVYPALIALFLLIATGNVPVGLQYEQFHSFAASWLGKAGLFGVLFLSLWHAAHRLRSVAHDFGIRKDKLVANTVYLVAVIGSLLTAFYLFAIK